MLFLGRNTLLRDNSYMKGKCTFRRRLKTINERINLFDPILISHSFNFYTDLYKI